MPCPEETELVRFAQGTLAPAMVSSVSEHLDSCDSCRLAVAEAASETVRSPAQRVPGTRVGRYRVDGLLGQGAMGAVFSGVDERLGRRVALKLLHGVADEASTARLEREAQSMARLNHPNVVTLYEIGESEAGRFIAMELVDGQTLDRWLPHASAAERRATLLDAGRGLSAAHDAGVVHRDFKPTNLLMGRDGRVRVSDFGLSRGEPGVHVGEGSMLATQLGTVIGTPAYMAPEQLEGKTADARSDQFSFAVVWCEALTGQRPFDARSRDSLREAFTRAPQLGPGLTAGEKQALRRALSIEPARRFPSMTALLAALTARRKRWPELLAAVALVALVGVGAWLASRPPVPFDPLAGLDAIPLDVDMERYFAQPCVDHVAIADAAVADVRIAARGFVLAGLAPGHTTLRLSGCADEPRLLSIDVRPKPETNP